MGVHHGQATVWCCLLAQARVLSPSRVWRHVTFILICCVWRHVTFILICWRALHALCWRLQCSSNFLSVKGPELINMYVGESERQVSSRMGQCACNSCLHLVQ
jgi:hypothetical protein